MIILDSNATDCVMCYHVYVIMHAKDPQLFVVRVGHCVSLADVCLPLYNLHVMNRDVNIIQKSNGYWDQHNHRQSVLHLSTSA